MNHLSTEHTLIAAVPILVILAVLSAAIIVFPKTNLDTRSKAAETLPQQKLDTTTPVTIPTTIEPAYTFPETIE